MCFRWCCGGNLFSCTFTLHSVVFNLTIYLFIFNHNLNYLGLYCILHVSVFAVMLHRGSRQWQMHCTSCCGHRETGSADFIQLWWTTSPSAGGWWSCRLWHTVTSLPVMTLTWCHRRFRLSAIPSAVSSCLESVHVMSTALWLYSHSAVNVISCTWTELSAPVIYTTFCFFGG